MTDITYGELTNHILTSFPQLGDEFQEEYGTEAERIATFEEEPELKARWVERGLALEDPGPTIVLENIFVPYLIETAQKGNVEEAKTLMEWVETLANAQDNKVQNAVALGISPALITNYVHLLPFFAPLMGDTTKRFCRQLFALYIVDDEWKQLLRE